MSIFIWIATVEMLSFLAWPLAFRIFRHFPDRGYGLTKPLGILLLAYPLWIAGSFGVFPINRPTIAGVAVALLLLAIVLIRGRSKEMRQFVRSRWVLLIGIEAVFLALLVCWIVFRAYDPGINHTEQLMDFAFLNASVQAIEYPPEDPWLRGNGISYYYFGYLMMGLLTKLTGIPTALTYNLSLALVPAMAAAALLSLVVKLVRGAGSSIKTAFIFGVGGVVLLGLIGNGVGVLEFANAQGFGAEGFWEFLGIKGLDNPSGETSWFPNQPWWWFRATRTIDTLVAGGSLDYTIHEFPFFSFLLGDLHPHLMALPFVMLALGFGLNIVSDEQPLSLVWLRQRWTYIFLAGMAVGAVGFVNAWDLPTVLGLMLGFLVLKSSRDLFRRGKLKALSTMILAILLFAALTILMYFPFYTGLVGKMDGIKLVEGPVTRPIHFLIVWSTFLFLIMPFLTLQVIQAKRERFSVQVGMIALGLAFLPYGVWSIAAMSAGFETEIIPRLVHLLFAFGLLTLVIYRTIHLANSGSDSTEFVSLVFIGFGFLLLVGPELFYVSDLFNSRMNTVFKLYYQSWIILAIASPPCVYYAWQMLTGSRYIANHHLRRLGIAAWLILTAVPILGGCYYSIGAVEDKTKGFTGSPTLDGLAYLKDEHSGEYEAIHWLLDNAQSGVGVLEAIGGDYSTFGRMAASTGLPTILGWPGHQQQWRGSLDSQNGRAEDAATIYRGEDDAQVRKLLKHYAIRFVIIGPRERSRYNPIGITSLGSVMKLVFLDRETAIYRVDLGAQ
jgi:YYY domain-containing protein